MQGAPVRCVLQTLLLSLCFASSLSATSSGIDKSPWLGRVFEFEAKGIYEYEKSSQVALEHEKKRSHTHANKVGAGLVFTAPTNWDIALQLQACETEKHCFAYDSTKVQVRNVLLDDLVSDPISLAVGVECSLQQKPFLKDINLFHHGNFESLFFTSIGKEFEYREARYLRTWAMAGVGVANAGSSWTRTEAHVTAEITQNQTFDLAFDFECGNGHKKLTSPHHFPGYSHLAYHFSDIGLVWRFQFQELGSLCVEAKKRFQARYCPSNTTSLLIGFDIPFSF
jgi:hypothetical protein